MPQNILILGAGFGGLEFAARLSDALGDDAHVTLIDKNEGFVFGFSKFELMFGRATLPEVTHYYRDLAKPGVTFRQETITAIDPAARRVMTDRAMYRIRRTDCRAGRGVRSSRNARLRRGRARFYSVPGAIALYDVLTEFQGGALVLGVLGLPFKCPPAPCEAAMCWTTGYASRAAETRRPSRLYTPGNADSPVPRCIPGDPRTFCSAQHHLPGRPCDHPS